MRLPAEIAKGGAGFGMGKGTGDLFLGLSRRFTRPLLSSGADEASLLLRF
jgi:hypothetical protein